MKSRTPLASSRLPIPGAGWMLIAAALLATACTTAGDAAVTTDTARDAVRSTGTVASIDTQPWTYDGNAVVQVDTADRGRIDVQLPARWNLCQAGPIDVEALAIGMQVEVVGAAAGEGAVVVCEDPSHRLVPVEPARPPANATGNTVGGDGSAIELLPLSDADMEGAMLEGELACAFSIDGGGTLLLAKGNVASNDPSRGVVNVAGYVEPVAAPGGFDAMLRGTRFSGAGKVVQVELTGPAIGGGESPPHAATLTYQRADGAERAFPGQWQCGP